VLHLTSESRKIKKYRPTTKFEGILNNQAKGCFRFSASAEKENDGWRRKKEKSSTESALPKNLPFFMDDSEGFHGVGESWEESQKAGGRGGVKSKKGKPSTTTGGGEGGKTTI